ncbi:MAG: helix-turn-helix domain-containing protein [Pseudomonadota bacterium]
MSNPGKDAVLAGLPTSPVPLDQCGMADTASLLGDKWMLLILREVSYGVTRFDDLKRELEMSSATLSNRAARLVEIGMLERREYREDGSRPRAQYLLTEMGRAFGKVLWAMMEWGDAHLEKGKSPIELVSPESGKSLRLALVDDQGAVTEFENAQPVIKT